MDVVQKQDGASYLQLKVPSKTCKEGLWEFLERYGYRYGDGHKRPLLPSEVIHETLR